MNLTDIAAVIGAAAWIPQIIRYFSRAELKIIPELTIELGYSSLGSIINPTCAFSASKKDALIEKMALEIIRQDGEKHEFLWQALDEKGFEGRSSKGETVEMRRTQSATALKIGIVGLVDRKILFLDTTIKEKRLALEKALIAKEDILKSADAPNFPDNVFRSDEFTNLGNHYRDCFYWKEGSYSLNIIAQEATRKDPIIGKYTFSLSRTDKNDLEKNIVIAQEFSKLNVLYRAGKIAIFPFLPWNWIYPTLTKIQS
ncbi:MAG: hypothetical protein Q8O91_05595 [Candidatus Aminicenantes bacterium]|nr:hypothetical protein [Candidatus Aminicenantes bacterium]